MSCNLFDYPFAVSLPPLACAFLSSYGLPVACLLATLQHVTYGSVWFVPGAAGVLSRNHSRFVAWSYTNKITTVFFMLAGALVKHGVPTHAHQGMAGLAAFLLVYGCSLNVQVHHLLGVKGIYYGNELGLIKKKDIKWIDGYPYNVMSHPQYIGASLQILGGVALWGFESDLTVGSRYDVVITGLYMCFLYLVTSQIEMTKPLPVKGGKK